MRATIDTVLDAPADRVWAELRTTRLWLHVSWPLLVFTPVDPPVLPATWPEGRHRLRMRAFGILPVGSQWVVTSLPEVADHARGIYRIRDQGSGSLAHVWDHLVTISARSDSRADYQDVVDVEAGVLTPFIWAFAHVFYRYRQWRWRSLVARGFRYPGDEGEHEAP